MFLENIDLTKVLNPFGRCLIHVAQSILERNKSLRRTYGIIYPSILFQSTRFIYKQKSKGAMLCNGKRNYRLKQQYEASSELEVNSKLTCRVTVLVDPYPCYRWQNTARDLEDFDGERSHRQILPKSLRHRDIINANGSWFTCK